MSIESIINLALKHRGFVVFITSIAALFGLYSLLHLPIDAVPDITNNQVQINTEAKGLSPEETEKQVTFPIESALADIPGLLSTRSISRNGFSQVTAIFDDTLNIYFARQQINERLQQAKEWLPGGIEPKMGPVSTGLGEIYMWTVEYKHPAGEGAEKTASMPGWQPDGGYLTPEGELLQTESEQAAYLREVQDWIIAPQLKRVQGLAGVDSIGGFVKQYDVAPDPQEMKALGITFDDLHEALERNNLSIGPGFVEKRHEAYLVTGGGRIESAEEIRDIVLQSRGGIPITISDVAAVSIGKEMRTGSATENGNEVVIGTALMLIGENSRTVSNLTHQKMEQINKSLPPDIQAKTVLNRTKLVDATIKTVSANLAEGALLVIATLFFMLGNFRCALIAASIIPLSMLLTAIGMVKTGISGNLMSLGALDFGLIVDGTIIIAENCLRRIAERQKITGSVLPLLERLKTVAAATKEMIQPTVYGQIIIFTVYIPLLTFSGVEGKMFHPMAATVLFALFFAFILSITFTPAMIALAVRGRVEEKENFAIRKAKAGYGPLLQKALRHPGQIAAAGGGAAIFALALFFTLGQEFIPALDEQDIALQAMRIPSTSLAESTAMQKQVEKTLSYLPEVAFVFSKTGTAEMASDPMPPNLSDTFVILHPKNQWPDPTKDKLALIEEMEHALSHLPGNLYEFTQPIEMRFNELIAGIRSDVAVKIYGDNFETMQKTAQEISSLLSEIKGAADLKVSQTGGLPTLQVHIDKSKAGRLGLSSGDILEAVSTAIGGKESGMLLQGDRRFPIVVRLPEAYRLNPALLHQLPIPFNQKEGIQQFLALSEVASITEAEGMNEINRQDGKRVVIVQANVRGRDLGSFVSEAKQKINRAGIIPAGYWIEWGGQFEHLLSAKNRLLLVIPLCFSLILLLLYRAFSSLKDALLVFTGVPLAATGGIAALWLRSIPFSISAAVGFIALSGIAVLNGLVMLTYIRQLIQTGKSLDDAIYEGAMTRLRPVLMTALVASLGFIPMAIATGTGAEVQRPLATVVIGGLISSTLLTLLVLPALYKLFAKQQEPTDS